MRARAPRTVSHGADARLLLAHKTLKRENSTLDFVSLPRAAVK